MYFPKGRHADSITYIRNEEIAGLSPRSQPKLDNEVTKQRPSDSGPHVSAVTCYANPGTKPDTVRKDPVNRSMRTSEFEELSISSHAVR